MKEIMSNKRTQGWHRVLAVTVGSLLSVACSHCCVGS